MARINLIALLLGILISLSTILAANTGKELNGIFERVLRKILREKMLIHQQEMMKPSSSNQIKMSNPSNEMEMPSKILSNLLWEIQNKIVEKTIQKQNSILNGKAIDFFQILKRNGFLAEKDNLIEELKKEQITMEEHVKLLNLFLSFAIRLGYHLGSNELNKYRDKGEKIELEEFVKAYNAVEKEFEPNKNGVSILPISILEGNARIKFNQQQDEKAANYKIYNFETIRLLLDWKEEHSLDYWIKVLKWFAGTSFLDVTAGTKKRPLDRLMSTWTGKTDVVRPWSEINLDLHAICALYNFGVNMEKRIGKYFPDAPMGSEEGIKLIEKFQKFCPNLLKSKNWEEIEAEMHYEDAIFIHGMQNNYRQIEKPKENFGGQSSSSHDKEQKAK